MRDDKKRFLKEFLLDEKAKAEKQNCGSKDLRRRDHIPSIPQIIIITAPGTRHRKTIYLLVREKVIFSTGGMES